MDSNSIGNTTVNRAKCASSILHNSGQDSDKPVESSSIAAGIREQPRHQKCHCGGLKVHGPIWKEHGLRAHRLEAMRGFKSHGSDSSTAERFGAVFSGPPVPGVQRSYLSPLVFPQDGPEQVLRDKQGVWEIRVSS